MKSTFALLVSSVIFLTTATVSGTETERIYLSGKGPSDAVEWDFYCSSGRRSGAWTTIPVPSNWEQEGFGTYDYGHIQPDSKSDESGTYRVRFHAPEEWQSRVVRLVFEGAMSETTVKLNGIPIGPTNQGSYNQFHFTITDTTQFGKHAFRAGEDNELEIHVSKKTSNASLEAAERKADFWVFGGIYRPVYLEVLPKAFINRVAIDADSNGLFTMHAFPQVHLRRTSDASDHVDQIEAQIETLNGDAVGQPMRAILSGGGTSRALLQSQIQSPALWSPEFPNLYQVHVTLKNKDKVLHEITERFGFRTFERRMKDGLYLNGKKFRIRGVNRNTFRPDTARSIDPKEAWDDAHAIKSMNANTVRCHITPTKAFLNACDELGLLFIPERTNWQRPIADTLVSRTIVYDQVTRFHNHPSLAIWANGNEGGFNFEVDELFTLLDLQNRPIIHPWASFDGIDTKHYLNYTDLKRRLAENSDILLPTELLHGLFDGGAGAGMDDYWKIMRTSELSAGGIVWCWADSAIERTDLNRKLDTDGNHSADGIVGPYGEKEASYYTLREIWSPLQIPLPNLPHDFTGHLPIENRFYETSLSQCTFQWRLLSYNDPMSNSLSTTEIAKGNFKGPAIAPGATGSLHLPLPSDWKSSHTLEVTAKDPYDTELMTWSWSTGTRPSPITSGNVRVQQDRNNPFKIQLGDTTWTFSSENGQLLSCIHQGNEIGLESGPKLYAGTDEKTLNLTGNWTAKTYSKNGSVTVEAKSSDGSHYSWNLSSDGSVTLDYTFVSIHEELTYCAIGFELPAANIVSKRWSGDGPYRIWENRRKGPQYGQWENGYNDAIPGNNWAYPTFKGVFGESDWMRVDLHSGSKLLIDPVQSADIGLLKPSNMAGQQADMKNTGPRKAKWEYPQDGGLFIFHKTPAIGTKFKDSAQMGPQSRPRRFAGQITGIIQFQVR